MTEIDIIIASGLLPAVVESVATGRRRPARAGDPLVAVPLKVPQTKVEMVLEQLVSSPFIDDVKNARPPKNFTAPKFNQYDPKIGDAVARLIHY